MTEFEPYVHKETFAGAAREARWLAKLTNAEARVRRDGRLWSVLVPAETREGLIGSAPEAYGQGLDEESSTRTRDFSSDQDDWARSGEAGWFYED